MIVKLFQITIFLLGLMAFGQTYRVYYELTFRPTKTDTLTKKVDQILIFNKDKSSFQDYKTMVNDSLFVANRALGAQNLWQTMNTDMNPYAQSFIIVNDLNKKEITYSVPLVNAYQYTEPMNLRWSLYLSKERKTILGQVCQKATTEYGGRKWEAWFTAEYPVTFGPYKFSGLPGLILELHDSENNYVWKAKAIQKQNDPNLYGENYFVLQGMGQQEVSKNDFLKIQQRYKEHPFADVMQHLPDPTAQDINDLEAQDKERAEKMSYYNNPIELK